MQDAFPKFDKRRCVSEKTDDRKRLNLSKFDLFFYIKNSKREGAVKIGSVCMICLVAGVALSVFEYALQIGATQSNMGGKKALRIAAVYSGIQLLLLLGGTLAAELIRNAGSNLSLERLWRTLLVALLLFYSFLCMRTAICGKGFEERREAEPKNGVVAKYAARAGLHMLLIGMAAWYISHGSLWQIVSIWISAFLAAVGGLAYGYWYGTKWRRQISFGLFLLLTGGLFAVL